MEYIHKVVIVLYKVKRNKKVIDAKVKIKKHFDFYVYYQKIKNKKEP
jgi:hypothetical protein